MPLIDTTMLLRIADRAAYQYGQIKTTLAAISVAGTNGKYFDMVTDTEDPDVEIPTVQDYENADNDFLPGYAAKNGTLLGSIIGGMEAHFNRRDAITGLPLQVGGWDGYLYANGKRVSEYFAELFFACHGFYMLAVNVFSEGVDTFATGQRNAGPGITFTDGVNYGDGSTTNPANGIYFAATQLKVYVVSMGGAQLDLRLSVKDVNNNPTTIDVSIPGGSAPATEIVIGGISDRFLDVTNIILKPGGSAGTLNDKMEIRNKKERQIQL
jgi:hypothetical protein